MPYDVSVYGTAKVHRDHHIEVAHALYSVPGALTGRTVEVRADSQLVRIWHRSRKLPSPSVDIQDIQIRYVWYPG